MGLETVWLCHRCETGVSTTEYTIHHAAVDSKTAINTHPLEDHGRGVCGRLVAGLHPASGLHHMD